MMITLLIYIIIISLIIFKGFYKSFSFMKTHSIRKNTEILSTSIQLESLPFYINQGKINLFAFFINFFLISLISCTLIPELIFNGVTFCMDSSDEESISSIDSDHGKSISNYYGENDIYAVNKNREEENSREEQNYFFIEQRGQSYYYRNDYEGIYKKTIEETYKISDKKFPYIHFLNSFSDFRNDNSIEIKDYLKVFQGFSKDIEKIMEKQNNLIQKITPIDKHSFKIYRIRDMFSEISERSMDTLYLISFAYDTIMDSYNNILNNSNSSNSSNSSSFEENNILKHNIYSKDLLNKILNNKTNNNEDINENIESYINGDHQVNNLNQKVSKIFNSLEIVNRTSKENFNNLHELIARPRTLKALDLKINNDNILIIQDIYSKMPEENQIKTFEELYNYYKKFDEDDSDRYSNINWNKIETILCNIRDFCKSKIFIRNPYQIRDTGFILKDIDHYYDESSEKNYNYFSEDDSSDGEFDSIERNNMGYDY